MCISNQAYLQGYRRISEFQGKRDTRSPKGEQKVLKVWELPSEDCYWFYFLRPLDLEALGAMKPLDLDAQG